MLIMDFSVCKYSKAYLQARFWSPWQDWKIYILLFLLSHYSFKSLLTWTWSMHFGILYSLFFGWISVLINWCSRTQKSGIKNNVFLKTIMWCFIRSFTSMEKLMSRHIMRWRNFILSKPVWRKLVSNSKYTNYYSLGNNLIILHIAEVHHYIIIIYEPIYPTQVQHAINWHHHRN